MEAITSFTLKQAFRNPGTIPHRAPPSIAASRATAAHNKLPRRTDIEQACLKGKANGKTGQYDGGCIVKHLSHALQTVGKGSCQDGHKSRQCLGRIAYKEYDESYQQSDNNGKDR